MISFYSETNFILKNQTEVSSWLSAIITSYEKEEGELIYIFCDDAYLLKLNQQFLNHDTLTDIISFDSTLGNLIGGEIYISIERVIDNAKLFKQHFIDELHRVMIHGVLHFIGFKDQTENEQIAMRNAENKALASRGFIINN